LERRLAELPKRKEIVAYCRGPYCLMSYDAVHLLRKRGMKARRLEDGLPEWRLAGLPIERLDHWRNVAAFALITTSSMVYADEGTLKALAQGGHVILVRHAAISGHGKALTLDPNGNCANEET